MKLRNRLLTLLFCFSAMLYFSATCTAQRLPEGELRFHKNYTEKGLIFGSITFPNEKMRFDSYYIRLDYNSTDKKLTRKNTTSIRIVPSFLIAKHYGELQGGKTYLFVIEKPIGNYNISWIKLSLLKYGQYVSNDTNLLGFSIPFVVNKGEITYIGKININEYDTKDLEVITLDDKFERDKNAMKNLYKMVNWDSAVKSELEIDR